MANTPTQKVTLENVKTNKQTVWTFKFRKSRTVAISGRTVTMGNMCNNEDVDGMWYRIAHFIYKKKRSEIPVAPEALVKAFDEIIAKENDGEEIPDPEKE